MNLLYMNEVISSRMPTETQRTEWAEACGIIETFIPGPLTTKGNRYALCNLVGQAVSALKRTPPHTATAIEKLEKAIERTNGCELRNSPDGNGKGREDLGTK